VSFALQLVYFDRKRLGRRLCKFELIGDWCGCKLSG
jgi:hypothetical protein